MTVGFWRGAENSVLFLFSRNILCYAQLVNKSLGDLCDSGTPSYISNLVVKAVSADGTRRVTSRESRSLPRDFFCLIDDQRLLRYNLDAGIMLFEYPVITEPVSQWLFS